jgi:NRPS condensation-like uncharacterized protein
MILESRIDDLIESTDSEQEISIEEIRFNDYEITMRYDRTTKELCISHFYISEDNRRNNLGTKIFNILNDYSKNADCIYRFKFQIKDNKSSKEWLDNLGETYSNVKIGGVGPAFEINKSVQ